MRDLSRNTAYCLLFVKHNLVSEVGASAPAPDQVRTGLKMNDELKIQTSALAEFVCDGNEALQFRLVSQI